MPQLRVEGLHSQSLLMNLRINIDSTLHSQSLLMNLRITIDSTVRPQA